MHHSEDRATCSDRVRINAFAGLGLFVVGDVFLALSTALDGNAVVRTIVAMAGIAGIMLGLYYVLCYLNRGVIVSEAGLTYRSWRGRRLDWEWGDVTVLRHSGKNMRIEFRAGGRKIVFYGYCENAAALDDWLYEHGKYENLPGPADETGAEAEAEPEVGPENEAETEAGPAPETETATNSDSEKDADTL